MNRRTLALSCAVALLAGCEGRLEVVGGAPSIDPHVKGRLACSDRKHPATTVLHRLTPAQYQHAIRDIFEGAAQPSAHYPGSFGAPVTGYSTEEGVNQVGEQGAVQLQLAAEAVALDVDLSLPRLLPCVNDPAPGAACLDRWMSVYARRAFRRTLTSDEQATVRRAFDEVLAGGGTFADGIAVATALVLQSPQFLYVVEDAAGLGRPLTGAELASRLSFFFWDSVPDDELLTLGETEQLTSPAVLEAQARRLFDSPRADAALTRYFQEWTQARRLVSTDKDRTMFPFFDAAYAEALDGSFARFVLAQARSGTLTSLFTSTEAYVDEHLAPSFGVEPPSPGTWTRVRVEGTKYAGLTTHPQVLAANAHTQEASYVFRGRTVQKRFLCAPMASPPANAQAVFSDIPLSADPTARETSNAVNTNPTCAGCHRLMDPPGLALEHFDAVGRWRDAYPTGRAIDARGALLGLDGEGADFDSPVSLAHRIVEREDLDACMAAQLFRFTFSRPETEADGCALQAVTDALDASGGDLSKALLAITSTDAFAWRADP